MKVKKALVFIISVSLVSLIADLSFAQETKMTAALPAANEPEVQWLWGEVVSIDLNAKQIVLKYFDYETDQDKEMTVNIDEQTAYDNLKSIDEIKLRDTVSIDYIVSLEGRSIARYVSLEKPEGPEKLKEETSEEPLKEVPLKEKQ